MSGPRRPWPALALAGRGNPPARCAGRAARRHPARRAGHLSRTWGSWASREADLDVMRAPGAAGGRAADRLGSAAGRLVGGLAVPGDPAGVDAEARPAAGQFPELARSLDPRQPMQHRAAAASGQTGAVGAVAGRRQPRRPGKDGGAAAGGDDRAATSRPPGGSGRCSAGTGPRKHPIRCGGPGWSGCTSPRKTVSPSWSRQNRW